MAESLSSGRGVLSALEGRGCEFCADGTLVRERYKGNRAAVCDSCGTPRAQFWAISGE
ncbi:HVO_A0556 family zinc finger protein [Salinilacihabitans rarus]|uniref:HVO_A0556 family zinc finger protein n=1 Tax=Salinilacihabitans rarus TaxID=2961596 RepID=UPI0020C865BC|nr:HVO_A0556 family zinc finger protein [Salinilacihabitans rarus]